MTNNQESEGNSTFYTTSVYDLGLLVGDSAPKETSLSLFQKILAVFSPIKTAIFGTFRISWEATIFVVALFVYIQKKAVSFVYFLEETKDFVVKILMWRRGLLFRPTTHGGLLAIGSAALVIGSLFQSQVTPKDFTRDSVLAAVNNPQTIIPAGRARSEIIKQKVVEGQTLAAFATKYNVSVDSIKWANGLQSDSVKQGDELAIPPVTGMIHKVKSGDSVESIAKEYKANSQAVIDYPYNYIDDTLILKEGQMVMVPDGVKPAPASPRYNRPSPAFVAAGGGLFTWPVPGGAISQYVSWWHPAVDIAAPWGSPIYATAVGTVTYAAFSPYGFGNHVIVDHGNGYTSAYAHMSSFSVSGGQQIGKGQLIGNVGCTGRCTGPHLHLEVRFSGQAVNPLSLF